MNAPIFRLFVLFAVLFAVLIGFSSRWAVFGATGLRENPKNSRVVLEEQRIKRGIIRAADGTLLGMAAMKDLGDGTAEIKSMRTAMAARGIGLGRRLLEHAIEQATAAGCREILLETGSEPHFAAARGLYLARGFVPCPPFADYADDPNSVYLRLPVPQEPESTTA